MAKRTADDDDEDLEGGTDTNSRAAAVWTSALLKRAQTSSVKHGSKQHQHIGQESLFEDQQTPCTSVKVSRGGSSPSSCAIKSIATPTNVRASNANNNENGRKRSKVTVSAESSEDDDSDQEDGGVEGDNDNDEDGVGKSSMTTRISTLKARRQGARTLLKKNAAKIRDIYRAQHSRARTGQAALVCLNENSRWKCTKSQVAEFQIKGVSGTSNVAQSFRVSWKRQNISQAILNTDLDASESTLVSASFEDPTRCIRSVPRNSQPAGRISGCTFPVSMLLPRPLTIYNMILYSKQSATSLVVVHIDSSSNVPLLPSPY